MTEQQKKQEKELSKRVRLLWAEYDQLGDLTCARAQQIRDEARDINRQLDSLRSAG